MLSFFILQQILKNEAEFFNLFQFDALSALVFKLPKRCYDKNFLLVKESIKKEVNKTCFIYSKFLSSIFLD